VFCIFFRVRKLLASKALTATDTREDEIADLLAAILAVKGPRQHLVCFNFSTESADSRTFFPLRESAPFRTTRDGMSGDLPSAADCPGEVFCPGDLSGEKMSFIRVGHTSSLQIC